MNFKLAFWTPMILAGVISSAQAFAAKELYEVPENELAKESVYPVFDNPVSVMNRNVVTEGRWDAGLFYGLSITEPIANQSALGVNLYYNTSEESAWGVLFSMNSTSLSDYAGQLKSYVPYSFDKVPKPQWSLMGDYNWKLFYGKMSITKNTVFNLSLFLSGSVGVVNYEHKTYPAGAVGIGQKFFFTKQMALRFDMRIYGHQAPVPFLKTTNANPTFDNFNERFTVTTKFDAGLSYLF